MFGYEFLLQFFLQIHVIVYIFENECQVYRYVAVHILVPNMIDVMFIATW